MLFLVHKVSHFFYDCNVKGRGSGYGIGSVGKITCFARGGKWKSPSTKDRSDGNVGASTDELQLYVYTRLQSTVSACL